MSDEFMGMSDKQYDGLIIDTIEDFEDIKELLENKQYDKALQLVNKKIEKNRRKLENS